MTATAERQEETISHEQYEAMVAPPPPIPTQAQIFDHQIKFWVGAGMATESELRRLGEFVPETGLFLLVPPKSDPIDYSKLMQLVVVKGRQGTNYLDPQHLTDLVTVPKGPYLALDIEDGRSRLNTAPCDSRKNLEHENRSGYLAFEGVVHAAVFPVLLHHYLDCVGSQYCAKSVPGVCVGGGEPALSGSWDDDASPGWGAPSCRERRGLRS